MLYKNLDNAYSSNFLDFREVLVFALHKEAFLLVFSLGSRLGARYPLPLKATSLGLLLSVLVLTVGH